VRVHFDVLGWLHMSAGVFSVLTGISLFVLGIGTTMALSDRPSPGTLLPVSAWLLFSASGMFILAGVLTFLIGRALVARRPRGRSAAIALAVPSLIVVPFGTALAVYSFWTLLNDDARREYGNKSMRPPAGTIL
jgi:hypothetical protein